MRSTKKAVYGDSGGGTGEPSVMEGLTLRHLSRVLRDLKAACVLEKESASCSGKSKCTCPEKRGGRKEE